MPITLDPVAGDGWPNAPFSRRIGVTAGDDDGPDRRKILRFPPPPADRCQLMARLATAVAERLDAGHVDIFEAAAEMLSLDDVAFVARLRSLQADDPGKALLAELFSAVRCAAVDFDRGGRVLFALSARLTAGLATTGGACGR